MAPMIFRLEVKPVTRQDPLNLVGLKHADRCACRKIGHAGEGGSRRIRICHGPTLLRIAPIHDFAAVALAPTAGSAADVRGGRSSVGVEVLNMEIALSLISSR